MIDGSPSFTVGTGDAVYFMHGFRCTWRILEGPLIRRYGYFGADGKELKDDTLTCDVCGADCSEESYLYDDEMDTCPRCFKLDAKSAQQWEDAEYQQPGVFISASASPTARTGAPTQRRSGADRSSYSSSWREGARASTQSS